MIKQLHPTLKKCRCHYIGTKRELYKHFDDVRRRMKVFGEPAREFFAGHGEVPLNVDDPKLDLMSQLEKSLREEGLHPNQLKALVQDAIDPKGELAELDELGRALGIFPPEQIIPSGHRLDDNNTEIPAR